MRGELVKYDDREIISSAGEQCTRPCDKHKQSGGLTPNYLKQYAAQTHPFLATIEAVTAHMVKLVCGANSAPKNRVIQPYLACFFAPPPVRLFSKTFENYESMGDSLKKLSSYDEKRRLLHTFLHTNRRDFAKLFVSLYCFQNLDLHTGNYGINQTTGLQLIDFDRVFPNFSKIFSTPERLSAGKNATEECLKFWPHLIYSSNDMFSVASPDDIDAMPQFTDIKPYNHPFHSVFQTECSAALQKDRVFVWWKFFYLTKFILFIVPDFVSNIIKAHIPPHQELQYRHHESDFLDAILAWKNRIQETLLRMPNYVEFLNNFSPTSNACAHMKKEIDSYNQEFCDKQGQPKPHKRHFIINPEWITFQIDFLKREAAEMRANDTPEKQAERSFALDLARLKAETTAWHTLKKEEQREIKKCEYAKQLLTQHPFTASRNLLSDIEKQCVNDFHRAFFPSYNHFNMFFKCFPAATVADFLKLQSLSIPYYSYKENQHVNLTKFQTDIPAFLHEASTDSHLKRVQGHLNEKKSCIQSIFLRLQQSQQNDVARLDKELFLIVFERVEPPLHNEFHFIIKESNPTISFFQSFFYERRTSDAACSTHPMRSVPTL